MFSRFLDGADSYGQLDENDPGIPDTLPYQGTGNYAPTLMFKFSIVGAAVLLLVVGFVRF
jgi:hypothetical protein